MPLGGEESIERAIYPMSLQSIMTFRLAHVTS